MFASASTLESISDKDVRSGKVSLNALLILYFLHYQRSVRGRLLIGVAKEALSEQISAQEQATPADEFHMGAEK
jgi:hypothetical protein